MINWKVRVNNKNFWLAIIPAVLLLVQTVLACFGVTWDYSQVSKELIAVINALFVVLAILGVVNDPTTATLGDSTQALGYVKPRTDETPVPGVTVAQPHDAAVNTVDSDKVTDEQH